MHDGTSTLCLYEEVVADLVKDRDTEFLRGLDLVEDRDFKPVTFLTREFRSTCFASDLPKSSTMHRSERGLNKSCRAPYP